MYIYIYVLINDQFLSTSLFILIVTTSNLVLAHTHVFNINRNYHNSFQIGSSAQKKWIEQSHPECLVPNTETYKQQCYQSSITHPIATRW